MKNYKTPIVFFSGVFVAYILISCLPKKDLNSHLSNLDHNLSSLKTTPFALSLSSKAFAQTVNLESKSECFQFTVINAHELLKNNCLSKSKNNITYFPFFTGGTNYTIDNRDMIGMTTRGVICCS